jgi:hypothetical protein
MRERKPCVLARRRLRGWYVRLGKTFSFKAWPDEQANLIDAFANPFDAMCGWKAKYWPQRRLDLNS